MCSRWERYKRTLEEHRRLFDEPDAQFWEPPEPYVLEHVTYTVFVRTVTGKVVEIRVEPGITELVGIPEDHQGLVHAGKRLDNGRHPVIALQFPARIHDASGSQMIWGCFVFASVCVGSEHGGSKFGMRLESKGFDDRPLLVRDLSEATRRGRPSCRFIGRRDPRWNHRVLS